jgi:hypothetical protein
VVAVDHLHLDLWKDHFYVPTLFPIQSTAELAVAFHHLKDDIVWLLDVVEKGSEIVFDGP